jgi:hypothetical protein
MNANGQKNAPSYSLATTRDTQTMVTQQKNSDQAHLFNTLGAMAGTSAQPQFKLSSLCNNTLKLEALRSRVQ